MEEIKETIELIKNKKTEKYIDKEIECAVLHDELLGTICELNGLGRASKAAELKKTYAELGKENIEGRRALLAKYQKMIL